MPTTLEVPAPGKRRKTVATTLLLGALLGGGSGIPVGTIAATAAQAATSPVLDTNARLNAGDALVSGNGQYTFEMQSDGNAVIYGPGHVALWSTGTGNHPGSVLVNQGDGNLVVYAPGNRPIWNSGTDGRPAARLIMQDDANLVLYAAGNQATWSSGTSLSGGSGLRGRIVRQASGELGAARSKEGSSNCNYYSSQVSSGAGGCTTPSGAPGRKEAWCAQFVRWAYKQAGANNYTAMDAGARSITRNRTWRAGNALTGVQPGDMVAFRLHSGTTEDDHVGIVVRVEGNTISTVEGNTRSGAVAPGTHYRGDANISGYAAPVG